jgi:hypothetical protein
MFRRLSIIAIVSFACGGGVSGATQTGFAGPDALASECAAAAAQRTGAPSLNLCFAGVDYAKFPPGSIFQVRPDGTVATLFQRAADSLTSFAQAPDGTVYFTNALNGTALYKIDGVGESIVYQHSTYVRMVRVDSKGNVYFNESTGAGANGKIYKLVNGKAQLFYEVALSTVGGFWGDFGFDAQDRLWLSSSNIIPSQLYLVTTSGPLPLYTAMDSSLMGFRFVAPTRVGFAGQDSFLRLLDLCTGEVHIVYTVSGSLQTQDVNACPSVPPVTASVLPDDSRRSAAQLAAQ